MSIEHYGIGRSEAKKRADKKYRKKIMTTISVVVKRSERLVEMVMLASKKLGVSRNRYLTNAIQSQLARDGITIDMLPDEPLVIPEEPKPPKQCMVYLVTSLYLGEDKMPQEEYVTVVQTVAMAKKYIDNKFAAKARPEDWLFTIYGKNIEAQTKANARTTLSTMAKEAQKKVENYLYEAMLEASFEDEEDGVVDSEMEHPTLVGNRMISFTDMLWTDDFQPEYKEEVYYKNKKRVKKRV